MRLMAPWLVLILTMLGVWLLVCLCRCDGYKVVRPSP
jgi:hypothetical protein